MAPAAPQLVDDGQRGDGILQSKHAVAEAAQEKQDLQDTVDVARVAQIAQAAQRSVVLGVVRC